MKFNWGWGIGIFYGVFVILILSFVFWTTTLNRELVSEKYYAQDQVYQEHIDKINRAGKLSSSIKMKSIANNLVIQYPNEFGIKSVEGVIYFFRPSSSKLDFQNNILYDSSLTQKIDLKEFHSGSWKVKFEWKMNDSSYYFEDKIFIN